MGLITAMQQVKGYVCLYRMGCGGIGYGFLYLLIYDRPSSWQRGMPTAVLESNLPEN